MFNIRMGIPEMKAFWNKLQTGHRNGINNKKDEELRRYGMKVWQSYLENKTSKARRMYWVYGPDQKDITIIGLEPHPEDAKNGAYDRINLSGLP